MGERADEIRRRDERGDADDTDRVIDVELEGTSDVTDVAGDEDATEETEEIRAGIEQTRAEMSQTIDAIQQKLSPQQIAEQAKEAVRDATVGRAEEAVRNIGYTADEARYTVMETIKQNPIPAALAGIGLGWLFMNSRNVASRRPTYYQGSQSRGGYYGGASSYGGTGSYGGTRAWDQGWRGYEGGPRYGSGQTYYAGQGREQEQGGVGEAVSRVGETAGDLASQAQERAGEVADRAQYAMRNVGETAGDARDTVMDTIKNNPIPAALISAGLGLWYVSSQRGGSSRRPTYSYQSYQGRGGYYGGTRDWERGYEGDQGGVGGAVGRVGDTAGDIAGQAQERAGQLASEVQDRASQVASQAQYRVEEAQDEFQRMLNETPLAVGALAFALGAATGLVVPSTRQEQQFMGEARDTLVERAQEMAQETMQKVQRVAQEVTEEAKDTAQREAKNEGLTQQ